MKNIITATLFMSLSIFTFAQSLPNPDFESWPDEEPEFWNTPNPYTASLFVITVEKSTDAYSGDYSTKLETMDLLGGVYQVPGLITLAQFSVDFATASFSISGGLPLQENVSKLTGMYKYQGAEGDSASVLIYNFKRDDEGTIDTIGMGIGFLNDATQWTPFTVNMENLNYHVPDTFNVIIMSSAGMEFKTGSVLYLDSLAIETNTGIINLGGDQIDVAVYPVPSANYVNFETSSIEKNRLISIYNMVGKLINTYEFSDGKTKVSIKELPSGLYTYRVTVHNSTLSRGSFIKN